MSLREAPPTTDMARLSVEPRKSVFDCPDVVGTLVVKGDPGRDLESYLALDSSSHGDIAPGFCQSTRFENFFREKGNGPTYRVRVLDDRAEFTEFDTSSVLLNSSLFTWCRESMFRGSNPGDISEVMTCTDFRELTEGPLLAKAREVCQRLSLFLPDLDSQELIFDDKENPGYRGPIERRYSLEPIAECMGRPRALGNEFPSEGDMVSLYSLDERRVVDVPATTLFGPEAEAAQYLLKADQDSNS